MPKKGLCPECYGDMTPQTGVDGMSLLVCKRCNYCTMSDHVSGFWGGMRTDSHWRTKECELCLNFRADRFEVEKTIDSMVKVDVPVRARCNWTNFVELVEYDRKTSCKGFIERDNHAKAQ